MMVLLQLTYYLADLDSLADLEHISSKFPHYLADLELFSSKFPHYLVNLGTFIPSSHDIKQAFALLSDRPLLLPGGLC